MKCYLIFTTFIHNCYLSNVKNYRISKPMELISFFSKVERPVALRTRLTRKFCQRSFITPIYGYSFQFWIKTSIHSLKRNLLNAPNKRSGHLLIFRFFPDPQELIGTLPHLLIFWVCKVWNQLSSFWTQFTLNWSTKEFSFSLLS